MHLKNFPKRLDSKTTSLRITVPENLDLALEGLIRKVLREQPKTDHIHAFAAEYFETLLKIRDKAGAKYTSEQLCPFHNDEDAHEMIKLANTFNRPSKSRKDSPQAKDKMAEVGAISSSSSNSRTGRPKAKHGKQTTPDLIKKLPGIRPKPKGKKEESEKENHEEELLTDDPIKELVEKELEMEALAKRNKGEVKEDNGRSEATDRQTEETVVKDKHSPDNPETKQTEEKLTKVPTVEDEPSTTEKDSGTTDNIPTAAAAAAEEEPAVKKNDGDKPPTAKEDGSSKATNEANTKLKNGDGGSETVLEEAKDAEKEPEASPEQTGNDRTGPVPENKAAEVQEESETETNIEAEEVCVVEETLKTASAPTEDTDEQKIDTESAGQQEKQPEVGIEQKQEEQEMEQKESESTGTQKEPEVMAEQKQQEQGTEQGVEQKQSEANGQQKEQEQKEEQEQLEPGGEQKQQEPEVEQKQQELGVEQKQEEPGVEQKEQLRPEAQQKQPEQEIMEEQPETIAEQKDQEPGVEQKQSEAKVEQKEQKLGVEPGVEQKQEEQKKQEQGVEQEVKQEQEEPGVEQKQEEPGVEQKETPGQEMVEKQPEETVDQKNRGPGVEEKQPEAKMEQKEEKLDAEEKQQEQEVEQMQPEATGEQKKQPELELQQEQPQQETEENQPKTEKNSKSEGKNLETEEKPSTEENISGKAETTKPKKEEKSETEEDETASKEKAEEMTPTAEEIPTKEDEHDLLSPKQDDGVDGLDRSEQQKKDDESKEDPTATEESLKESDDKTVVGEEAGEDAEDGSPSTNTTAPVEKPEEHEPQDIKENQNGGQKDELNTTMDIQEGATEETQKDDTKKQEITEDELKDNTDQQEVTEDEQKDGTKQPGATEDDQKDNTEQQEEELCTVVDSHHIIRIEEPEPAPDEPTGVAPRPEEVQIKTIQTHYYDALQVPEIVTKEFRVHNVCVPVTEDAAKMEENNSRKAEDTAKGEDNNSRNAEDTAKGEDNNSRNAEDTAKGEDNNSRNAEDTAKGEDNNSRNAEDVAKVVENDSEHAEDVAKVQDNNSGHAEDAQIDNERTETADSAEKRPDDVPLLAATPGRQELFPDSVRSDDLLDLMTPTSGYSLNLSELSWQTVSGFFLDSERQHSSQLSDELRYKTVIGKPEDRDEIEEVFHRTVVPTLVGAVPMPPRDAEEIEKEESDSSLDEKKDKNRKKKLEDVGNSRSFDSDTPFISVEVKTVIETQVLDDEDEEDGRPRVQLMVQATVDVENVEETTKRQQNIPEGEEREMSEGEKACSGESDSTMSSAATEIKRSDSGRRAPGSLMQSQSLDLGGRNPLLRTRSLSTFRHGVTDFEVWNAIEKELEDAATKIQTKFRSYKARKKLQREDAVQITTEESSGSATPAEAEERQRSTGEFHDSIVLSDHPR